MNLYIVEAIRSSKEKHSYVIGVYTTKEQAILAGEAERSYRGICKYDYKVTEHTVNYIEPEVLKYHLSTISFVR